MATVMLKKMSAKTVLGESVKAPEEPEKLYTIYGSATGVKKGETAYGPWTMLTGKFEALRGDNVYVSTVCALPEPLHTMIVDAVMMSEGNSGVQFACDVMLHPADNAYGYEYFANPLVEQSEQDELSALRSQVQAKLEAPKAEDKKAK